MSWIQSNQLNSETKDFLNIMMGDENKVMIVLKIMKGDQDRVVQSEENWTWGWKQGNLNIGNGGWKRSPTIPEIMLSQLSLTL